MIKTGRHKARRRGFTILEVLVAVALMAIGLVAMMALQVAFVGGTTLARDSATAVSIGQSVVEQMRMEATMWTNVTNQLGSNPNTPTLNTAFNGGGQGALIFGGFPVNPDGFAPGFVRMRTTPLVSARAFVNAKFCVDVRAQPMSNANNGVLVGEVRVAWPSDRGAAPWVGAQPPVTCVNGGNLDQIIYIGGNVGLPNPDINVVQVPFAIRRHNL